MKPLRLLLVVVLVFALALSTAGCKKNEENIAARVNGDEITQAELNAQVEQLKKQYPEMFEGEEGKTRLLDFKLRLLDNLINQKLVEQAAKDRDLGVTDKDVEQQISQLKEGFADQKQYEQALKSAGMTQQSLESQIREQLVTQKLIESLSKGEKVSDDEVKAYYEKNKAQFTIQPAKRASHILFKAEDKKKAEDVLAKIRDGADFANLAKENSIDTATATKGGDLGWPTSAYVAEFENALSKLKKGEVSDLVQSPYGWHIIKVTDERKGSQQELADVKGQIEQIVVQQRRADAYQKFLDELRDKAKIEIIDPELKAASEKAGNPAASQETTSK